MAVDLVTRDLLGSPIGLLGSATPLSNQAGIVTARHHLGMTLFDNGFSAASVPLQMESVLRKRRRKMNKHKLQKRRKLERRAHKR